MKTHFKLLFLYFKRIFYLSLNAKKQDLLAWRQLKQMHFDAGWKSGIYESEMQIVTSFEIGNENSAKFGYYIENIEYHCKVNIVENYSPEMTTDFFILATHFNNLLNKGKVEMYPFHHLHIHQHKKSHKSDLTSVLWGFQFSC